MTTESIFYNSLLEEHYETMEEFAKNISLEFLQEVIEEEDHPALEPYNQIEIDAYSDYKRGYTTYLNLYKDNTGQVWGIEYSVDNWGGTFDVSDFQKYKERRKTIKYWEAA